MKKSINQTGRSYHHGDLERALVAAALDVIATDGVDALTLRVVGEKAGVSRSALYRHFDDKAALLARIATDGFRLLCETLMRVRANAPPAARDTLEVLAAAHVHFAQDKPAHYAIMFGGIPHDARRYPQLAQALDAAFGEIVEAVRDFQGRGNRPVTDVIGLADVLWAVTFGIARLGTSGHLHQSSTRLEELAVLGVRWVSLGRSP